MTGNEIYKRCLSLLGYTPTEQETVSTSSLLSRMPDILNQILTDLKLPEIKSLDETVKGTNLQIDAVCCGCAMLLSLSDGDNRKNRVFTEIYNARRGAALCETDKIKDNLPYTCDGGM